MDLESQETLVVAVKQAQESLTAVVDNAALKLSGVLRDGLANLVAAMLGWQLEITPITIKLTRKI